MAFADIFKDIYTIQQYVMCHYMSQFRAKWTAAEITGIKEDDPRHPIMVLEKSLSHLGLTNWGRQGAGVYTMVIRGDKLGDPDPHKVVRLSLDETDHYRIDASELKRNPLFLPVEASGYLDSKTGGGMYEMLPRAAIAGEPGYDYVHHPIENAVLAGLILYAQGQYFWEEVREDNVGIHKGKVVIIDPGAINDRSTDGFSVKTEMLMHLQHTYEKLFDDRFKETLKNRQSGMQIFQRFIAIGLTQGQDTHELQDKAIMAGLSVATSYDKSPAKLFIFDTKQEHTGLEIMRKLDLGGLAHGIKGPQATP